MNVCIIGDGLTSLSLAHNLINKKINVHIYCKPKNIILSSSRSIGMSKDNFDYYQKEVFKINSKYIWKINRIKIYFDKIKKDKNLNFEKNKKDLFLMIKNHKLKTVLKKKLIKNSLFKYKLIKEKNFYQNLLKENKYNLIINCDSNNYYAKKFFFNTTSKNYNNFAYTTILKHNKLVNNEAIQIFTKYGPLAFLPISNYETSVVYSVNFEKNDFSEKKIIDLIKEYNPKYLIKNIQSLDKFELKYLHSKKYYNKNILAFGDCIHKVHPLAGQGFNMTIRDIRTLSNIIQNKIDLGIQLDQSVCEEFEKTMKHKNFIFSTGIDFIYELFDFNRKIKSKNLNKVLGFIGNNKMLNNVFTKYADKGLMI